MKAVRRAERALEKEKKLLEVDGNNKKLQKNFKRANERMERERLSETRLFAIDAGIDADKLRKEYNDRSRYIITPGMVDLDTAMRTEKLISTDVLKNSV